MSNEVATKTTGAIKVIRNWTNNAEVIGRVESVVGGKDRALQFLGSLATVVGMNQSFDDVPPNSIMNAALFAAGVKLSIMPAIGECAIIPYWDGKNNRKVAQFQLMTNGIMKLAMQSGFIASLNSGILYKDQFNGYDVISGELNPPKPHDPKCTEVVGAFAFVRYVNGGTHTEYWTKEQLIDHAKKFSKTYDSGPWKTHQEAMMRKTVLKYLLVHYCPKSPELESALAADQATITTNKAGGFTFDYTDNPQNDGSDIPTVFSDEELAERARILDELAGTFKIVASDLVTACKDANTIDEVPTEFLRYTLCDNRRRMA